MNGEQPAHPGAPTQPPAPADGTAPSGEGASTALEALIRKRRLAETPDGAEAPPPSPR